MINEVLKKRRRDDGGKVVESRSYYLRYRFDPMPTDKWVSLRTSDKQVAQKKAQDFYQQKEHESGGLMPSKAARNAAGTPLLSHLSDYLADLKGRGKTQKHVDLSKARIGRLIKECNWKVFRDVEADDFIRWRNQNFQHTPKTLNDYLASAVSLLNWMEKFGRCPVNPLRHVVKADGRGKLKHGRRAFTDEELQRLLSLDSPNHLAYLLAVGTGLRRGELEQLTWGDINLEESAPYILARASTTKNKKEERVSLTPEISGELASCRPESPLPSSLVLPGGIPRMRELKKDIEREGIVYCDDKGLYADFHALRHTCATHMLKNGVSPILVKKHMRHSDLKLTTNCYTDQSQLDVTEALKTLPALSGNSAHICAQILGSEGQNEAQSDVAGCGMEKQKPLKTGAKVALWREEAQYKMVEAAGVEP